MRKQFTADEVRMKIAAGDAAVAHMARVLDEAWTRPMLRKMMELIERAEIRERVQRLLNPYYGIEAWRR